MPSLVREESYNSVRVFWLETDQIFARLQQRAEALVREKKALKVVLFGSLAKGRAVPGSDADLLIIVPGSSRPMKERITEYHRFFTDIGIPVDIFPYMADELDIPFANDALQNGIVLAEQI